jgi:hypothetical protein
MRHPFQAIPSERISRYLIPLSAITIVFMITLNWLGIPLNNPSTPNGIISFELAGDVARAKTILASWNSDAQLTASLSLGLDYLFLVVYSTAIGMACIWVTSAFSPRSSFLLSIGIFLAWGQWLAALFDSIENVALIKILFGDLQSPLPQVARTFALMKFALIALGLVYVLIGIGFKWIVRERSNS